MSAEDLRDRIRWCQTQAESCLAIGAYNLAAWWGNESRRLAKEART